MKLKFDISLKELLKDAHDFSFSLSNINRNLAFVGIAVVWIFKVDLKVPNELLLPLLMFVIALAVDLFQYIYSTFAWTIFYHVIYQKTKKKKDKTDENTIVKAPFAITYIQYGLFYIPKIIINVWAYIMLIIVIKNKII